MHTQKIVYSRIDIFRLFSIMAVMLGMAVLNILSSPVANAADDPCKEDPKAVEPECANPKGVVLTPKDTERAGLVPKRADNIVTQTLNGVYAIVAIIATITIVLAGIRFITADGDESKITAARKTVYYAVIGLAVVGSAFIITGIIQGVGTK